MSKSNDSNLKHLSAYKYGSLRDIQNIGKMHGAKRVLAFCCLTAILPTVLIVTPLYLRHTVFSDKKYPVAESDVVAIQDGVSSIFCESHSLHMNTSFNAFQLKDVPEISQKMKHIRLKKSMSLPDDTLEYWGFFLLKGAIVKLKVCSRYEGSRILVVRGEKDIKTCGLLQHNQKKYGHKLDQYHDTVKVVFENPAEEIGVLDDDIVKENAAAEDLNDGEDVNDFLEKRLYKNRSKGNDTGHVRETQILTLKRELQGSKRKRHVPAYDAHIEHGGNALNATKGKAEEDSVSSFETELLTCFDGKILLTKSFPPSRMCQDVYYLEGSSSKHMQILHEVNSDGYYYYIFYSDNDLVKNDVHAVFDIFKPTYRFAGNDCINSTECVFSLSFLADETVIVEVPTRDGIEHEADDITLLVSRCHPRMTVYMIFPIAVLFLILGCAFL